MTTAPFHLLPARNVIAPADDSFWEARLQGPLDAKGITHAQGQVRAVGHARADLDRVQQVVSPEVVPVGRPVGVEDPGLECVRQVTTEPPRPPPPELHAAAEDPLLKQDFYRSLLAAFTPEEVRRQLATLSVRLDCELVSDRHWVASGRR